MKRFAIPAPDELHRDAKAKAASDGISLTTVICRLVCGWVQGKIELPRCNETENEDDYNYQFVEGPEFTGSLHLRRIKKSVKDGE